MKTKNKTTNKVKKSINKLGNKLNEISVSKEKSLSIEILILEQQIRNAHIDRMTLDKTENGHLLKITPNDYHLFSTGTNNRFKNKGFDKHRKDLLNSVEICDITTAITVTRELLIGEGANRFEAWTKAGFTFYALVSKASLSDIFTLMNRTVKKLTYDENIFHCSIEGDFKEHYQTLIDMTARYKTFKIEGVKHEIQRCLIHGLLTNMDRTKSREYVWSKKLVTTPEIKARAMKMIYQICDYQRIVKNTGIRFNEGIIGFINEMGHRYNHALMIEKLTKANFVVSDSAKEITNKLSDVYEG